MQGLGQIAPTALWMVAARRIFRGRITVAKHLATIVRDHKKSLEHGTIIQKGLSCTKGNKDPETSGNQKKKA